MMKSKDIVGLFAAAAAAAAAVLLRNNEKPTRANFFGVLKKIG
jgi:hypothetical protein